MTEKIIVVYDRSIRDVLKKQAKINKRFGIFAMISSFYLVSLMLAYNEQSKKIKELTDSEGE